MSSRRDKKIQEAHVRAAQKVAQKQYRQRVEQLEMRCDHLEAQVSLAVDAMRRLGLFEADAAAEKLQEVPGPAPCAHCGHSPDLHSIPPATRAGQWPGPLGCVACECPTFVDPMPPAGATWFPPPSP